MVSFRDLVESMESDITVKECTVVISDQQPHTDNPEKYSSIIKQEGNPEWKSSIIQESLQAVKKKQDNAENNEINNHENKKLNQITNVHSKSNCDRRPFQEKVEDVKRRTSRLEEEVPEGTTRWEPQLSHASDEYVAIAKIKEECQQPPPSDPVENEDSDFEERDLSSHVEFQHAHQSFLSQESELQMAEQEFVGHENEFEEAFRESAAHEGEFIADQERVTPQEADQEFMAHEHSFLHASQELSKEHDPQYRSIVKEECSTLIKEEIDDSFDDGSEELTEEGPRHAILSAVTEPTWTSAYVPYQQQNNFLKPISPSVSHYRPQFAGLSDPAKSSTTSTTSASKVSHPTYAPVMHGRGTRPLSSTSFSNTARPLQGNTTYTKKTHIGNREKFFQDRLTGDGAQCWAKGGGKHRSWATPETPRCQAPCRSAEASVSGYRDRASTRSITGHISEATRGWRHAMPVKNERSVLADTDTQKLHRCDGRNTTGMTLRHGRRSPCEEQRHILAASGPHLLPTHRNDQRATTQDGNDPSSTSRETEDRNYLCSRHQPRSIRGSTTNNRWPNEGCDRQGVAVGVSQQGATERAGAGQLGTSTDLPLPYPASSSTFRCEVCEITRRDAESLARHWRLHAPGRPFACPFCPSRFNQLVHLQIHRRTHTGEKPFRCATCGSTFSRKDRLRCHERSHSGEKPYPCPDCEATFRDVASLKVHLASHTHHTTYTCRLCQATFAQLSTFTSHWRRQHNWGKDVRKEYT